MNNLYQQREESAEQYAIYQFAMARRFQKYLRRDGYKLEGLRVLDIGCGPGGESCGYMVQNPSILVAIDINSGSLRTAVSFAKQMDTHPEFICANVFELPFRGESFDVIFSNGMIEHLPEVDGLFPSLLRVLRPGGRIRLAFAPWRGPFSGHIRDQLPYPYIHLLPRGLVHRLIDSCRLSSHMTPERVKWKFDSCYPYLGRGIRSIAERQGFEIIREEYVISIHPAWVLLRMSGAKILGLRPYTWPEIKEALRKCVYLSIPFSFLFWGIRHLLCLSRIFREYSPDLYVLHMQRGKDNGQG